MKKFLVVLLFFLLSTLGTEVVAETDHYNVNFNIPILSAPTIISWNNNKTNDNDTNINMNIDEAVKFNIESDQDIVSWQWYKDGVIQNNNYNNFTTSWATIGNKNISVNGVNINGTTNIITWNVNILNQNQISLDACGNLNKSNSVYILNSSVFSSGTCFTIAANNVTLEGQGEIVNYAANVTGYGISDTGGYDDINIRNLTLNQQNPSIANAHGIYLRNVINSIANDININTKNNGEGIYMSSSNSNTLSNITITTSNNGAYGIYLTSSNSNYFSNCNITTVGKTGEGIYLISSSNSNSFSSCNITTTGNNGDGIFMASSNYNSYYDTNILASGPGASGIRTNAASFNNIQDGSIISTNANDYYLQNSVTNNFINTNFTTRRIYFNDNISRFNYINNNIMLNTSQITYPSKSLIITRTLLNWDQTNILWQEKVSTARMLNYDMSGLMPNMNYSVWNGSIISYNLTTDANGNLPNFNINLTTSSKLIKVSS